MVEISDITGALGVYQWLIIVLGSVIGMLGPAVSFVQAFIFPLVDHWCKKPPHFANMTTREWKEIAIPFSNVTNSYDQCLQYAPVQGPGGTFDRNVLVKCHAWDYDHSQFWPSGTEHWNLVCDDSWMLPYPQGLFSAGGLIGHILFGYLADKYGRRPVIVFNVLFASVFLCIRPFVPSFWVFVGFSFFAGFMTSSTITILGLLMEVTSSKYRCLTMIIYAIFWAVGFFLLSGISASVPEWQYQLLVFGIMHAACIPILWYTYESPRWLLSTGKYERAEKAIKDIAQLNRTYNEDKFNTLIPDLIKTYQKYLRDKKEAQPMDLMRSRNLRIYTVSMAIFMFFIFAVYNDLCLRTDLFPLNPYLNYIMSGVAELIGGVMSILVLRYWPRKMSTVLSAAVPAIIYIVYIFIINANAWIIGTLIMISRISVALINDFTIVYTGEIFPTGLRAFSLGIAYISGCLGTVVQPYVTPFLSEHLGKPLTYGCSLLLCALLALLWPETYKSQLPDFVEK